MADEQQEQGQEAPRTAPYPTYSEVAGWVQEIKDSQREIVDSRPDVSRLADVPTNDEARALAEEVMEHVDGSKVETEAIVKALREDAPEVTTVTLSTKQYSELRDLMSTQLVGSTIVVGLLALILGVAVGIVVTMHWRAKA